LGESFINREKALNQCLVLTTQNLQKLKEQKTASPNDVQVLRQLRNEQAKASRLLLVLIFTLKPI
jgi:hypothetical protein